MWMILQSSTLFMVSCLLNSILSPQLNEPKINKVFCINAKIYKSHSSLISHLLGTLLESLTRQDTALFLKFTCLNGMCLLYGILNA